MKIGFSLPYYKVPEFNRERILSWARRIDNGPFDTLICSERLTGGTLEMHTLLSAAAAVTERVRIMPTLYVLPMRAAVLTAKEIATLDIVSGGRVSVTVGVGGREEDYTLMGVPFERRHQRMDEQVATLRRVWRGEALAEGGSVIGPVPPQGERLPIYAGAMRPKAIARAAQWADGLCGAGLAGDRESHQYFFDLARAAWKEAGRKDKPYLIGGFWFSLGPNAAETLKAFAYDYMSTTGEESARGFAEAMTRSTPEAVREAIENVRAAGADEVILMPVTTHDAEIDGAIEVLS